MKRSSGVLLPMFSLPSPYGVGTMGKSAYEFIDALVSAKQSWWQLLPMGPTSCGDSPYQSFSTFAGNPYFIDPDMLIEEGLISPEDVAPLPKGADASRVDYGFLYNTRFSLLRRAYANGRIALAEELAAFRAENALWLENYALFMAIKAHFGMLCWMEWPDEDIRLHRESAIREYREKLCDEVEYYCFIQLLFFRQWRKLRKYASEKGIGFIGDVPIYVAVDSADVWAEPHFFLLDEQNRPIDVAGVPPDAFSEEGQLWGNPLYDWRTMEQDGFGWWIRRIDGARKLYDAVRIDHFRGFESYWAVPAGAKTAMNGEWRKGPGMKLVGVLTSWFYGMSFIAEDLGIITDDVRELLKSSGLPGMKVLEFAFDSEGSGEYLPHSCNENSVCYIGTHDNHTVLGWLDELPEKDRVFASRYMHITEDEGWCWGMIRAGMGCASSVFIAQAQDILEKPAEARMNYPGTTQSNWQWRLLPGELDKAHLDKLRDYTVLYRRENSHTDISTPVG